MTKPYSLLIAALLPAVMLLAPGCSTSGEDICDLRCDCQGCSNREYDDCVYAYDRDLDDAERFGCADLYDELIACQDDTGRCHGRDWDTNCGRERDDLNRCLR